MKIVESRSQVRMRRKQQRIGRYRERKERGGLRQQIEVGEREIVSDKEER